MAPREDAWLTERLGRPVLNVEAGERPPAGGPAMLQARVPADDIGAVRALTEAGLYVVDAALTLGRERTAGPAGEGVRAGCEADRAAVLAIAARAFRFSRFHLDPGVPDEIANRVKRDWMESYFEGRRGDALFVCEHDGEVAGFLGVVDREDASGIDLVAVAPEFHGRGIGRRMCEAFLAREAPERRVVGTQAANAPSLRLYSALGFRVEAAAFNLHGHLA